MSIQLAFNDFRTRFPFCETVAFADLSTGMVLAADTRAKMAQEKLDILCEEAFQALAGRTSAAIAREFGESVEVSVSKCVVVTNSTVRVFVRAPEPAQEALCIVLDSKCDVVEVLQAGCELLDQIMVTT